MARKRGEDDGITNKNTKLETFLKKSVSDDIYDRVRGYESCIVISEKENKSFKYVILGSEWIYLTENPPKSIQEAAWLGAVTSVDLDQEVVDNKKEVNDYPQFLSGYERENTQHLCVKYLTSAPLPRRLSMRKGRRSAQYGSMSDIADRSNSSTPVGSVSDSGYVTQSLSSLQVSCPGSDSSTGNKDKSVNNKKKKHSAVDLQEETVLKALKEELEEDILEDIEDHDYFYQSFQNNGHVLSPKRAVSGVVKYRSSNSSLNKSNVSKSSTPRPLPPPPVTHTEAFTEQKATVPKSSSQSNGIHNAGTPMLYNNNDTYEDETEKTLCGCGLFTRKLTKNVHRPVLKRSNSVAPSIDDLLESGTNVTNISSMEHPVGEFLANDSISVIDQTFTSNQHDAGLKDHVYPSTSMPLTSRSNNSTPVGEYDRKSLLGAPSISDIGSLTGDMGPTGEKRETALNIYLLSRTSPMLMLIRSAWNNYLFRSTLLLDPDYERKVKTNAVRAGSNQIEKTSLLFDQLKQELFIGNNSLDEVFTLCNELRLAAGKNFTIKKLFWKSSDMFLFLMHKLQEYLPRSEADMNTFRGQTQRADEFELVILMAEILSIMFRETEIISTRMNTLKEGRGKIVLDLLMLLTCEPVLPDCSVTPTRKASALMRTMNQVEDLEMDEVQTSQLLCEFTNVAVAAVFELFLMARQANWNQSQDNFFNISWMVQVLEELKTTEKFVDRVIQQVLSLIAPTRVTRLAPDEAVQLYQHCSVLGTFLEYSPRISANVRANFTEEFKYFVQPAIVEKKLPASYPITRPTIRLIDDVLSRVLNIKGVAIRRSPHL